MARSTARQTQPVAAFRNAVAGAVVAFLTRHAHVRTGFAVVGAILLIMGAVLSPFWNVPLLSWLTAGEVAAPCLAAGSAALGTWYLSGRAASSPENPALPKPNVEPEDGGPGKGSQ